ncbi:aspartate/glutamate racemase family protein [uncultured Amnibacterium sp.]|uniref:aspartate/glutamate racemase family protein n=1 Tax=uncultured Amnibacterium sp. TaxID=1631851 RepID=UPI0035CC4BA1
MSRIVVLNPNTSDALTAVIAAAAQQAAPADVEVAGARSAVGVDSVESHAEEAIAAVGVLERVAALDATTDAFVVACFGDTGVTAAREVASGPVVGMTEAALQAACLVAHRFAVITMPDRTIAHSERVVRALGLEHRCAVRALDVPVHDLERGSRHLLDAFAAEARLAIEQDRAEAIVLGCAGLADLVEPLREALGVPVVEGVAAGVGFAAALLRMGLRTSRASTYAQVPALPRFALQRREAS